MVYLGRNKKVKLSKKQSKALKKRQPTTAVDLDAIFAQKQAEKKQDKGTIIIPKLITVRRFAELLKEPINKVMEKLMANGVMASINESIDFDTAAIVADEFGAKAKIETQEKQTSKLAHTNLKSRPPVVVILGHVDHGKTTLLDAIRHTDIVSTESGGITQHIGAYQVQWKDKKNNLTPITFLDTPGHEAFSAMRAHGTNITDIAILVVAADDGVKPQTKEAISHIKSANIPVIVAINKIDKPGADPDRVKRQLADLGLNPEEWGGDTVMIGISAKQKMNIDGLLDMVILVAQMQDLKSQFDGKVEGVVIESHMQSGVGPVATVLINHGTLKKSDAIVIGNHVTGKIKIMENYLGKRIAEATPAMPVKIAGLSNVPNFGDRLVQVTDEREAKSIVASNLAKEKSFGIYEASEAIKSGKLKELSIVLKADTQGSLEAIKNTIEQLSTDKIKVKVISSGVSVITENDVNMAIASKALIMGFKVAIPEPVNQAAKDKKIQIKQYDIIYRLIEDVQAVLEGLVEPEINIVSLGKLSVIKIFHKIAERKLVGGKITEGKLVEGKKVRIIRNNEEIGSGKLSTIQIGPDKVTEAEKGTECGIAISTKVSIKPKDIIEQFKEEKVL